VSPEEEKRLRAELERTRAQLVALESVLSLNEHLVLKSQAFQVVELKGTVPWGVMQPEWWQIQMRVHRRELAGRGRVEVHHVDLDFQGVRCGDGLPAPRILFCLLPEPPRR